MCYMTSEAVEGQCTLLSIERTNFSEVLKFLSNQMAPEVVFSNNVNSALLEGNCDTYFELSAVLIFRQNFRKILLFAFINKLSPQ